MTEAALAHLRAHGVTQPVDTAIVVGTGMGALIEAVVDPVVLPFGTIPDFPATGVSGHAGELVIGQLEASRVAIMNGRAHYYEHGDMSGMRHALQTLNALGARTLILTNSVGSLHTDWYPGSLAVIRDHINLSGFNPLIGQDGDERFVSMTGAYDTRFRKRLMLLAKLNGVPLREATLMWFPGPSFETHAEIRFAKQCGADLVGMSVAPEVVIGRWLKMRVAALSVITNFGTGITSASPTHAGTKDVAQAGTIGLRRLIRAFLKPVDESPSAG